MPSSSANGTTGPAARSHHTAACTAPLSTGEAHCTGTPREEQCTGTPRDGHKHRPACVLNTLGVAGRGRIYAAGTPRVERAASCPKGLVVLRKACPYLLHVCATHTPSGLDLQPRPEPPLVRSIRPPHPPRSAGPFAGGFGTRLHVQQPIPSRILTPCISSHKASRERLPPTGTTATATAPGATTSSRRVGKLRRMHAPHAFCAIACHRTCRPRRCASGR